MTSIFISTPHSMPQDKKEPISVLEYFGGGYFNPFTMAQSSTLAQFM
jgi:hypothetical protein